MRMRIISTMVWTMVSMLIYSCSKDDTEPVINTGDVKNVAVKVSTLKSRAIENSVPTGTITPVQDAAMLFYTGNTLSYTHVLSAGDIAGMGGGADKSMIIDNVPMSADSIAFVANYIVSGQGTSYAGISGSTTIDVQNLQPMPGSAGNEVSKVIMYGGGKIGPLNTATNIADANFTASPIAARLEVSGIGKKGNGMNIGDITQFTLVGVFIPNHYPTGNIRECISTSATTGFGNGVLVKPANVNYAASFPNVSGTPYLSDFNAAGLPALGASSVYGYNLFPAAGAENLPNVVIAVKDVKYINTLGVETDWQNGNVQYITVTDYFTTPDISETAPRYTQFKNANVYGIKSLLFGLGDLGDEPYSKAKRVAVTLTVLPWTYQEIYPGI